MDWKKMKWNENDEMDEMDEMDRERESFFFFGKYKVSGDPDFHFIFSA